MKFKKLIKLLDKNDKANDKIYIQLFKRLDENSYYYVADTNLEKLLALDEIDTLKELEVHDIDAVLDDISIKIYMKITLSIYYT